MGQSHLIPDGSIEFSTFLRNIISHCSVSSSTSFEKTLVFPGSRLLVLAKTLQKTFQCYNHVFLLVFFFFVLLHNLFPPLFCLQFVTFMTDQCINIFYLLAVIDAFTNLFDNFIESQ